MFLSSIFCCFLMLSAETVDRIVAIVNNEIITETDISAFKLKLNKAGAIDDLLLFDNTPNDLKNNRQASLDFLINEKILISEIKKNNFTATQEKIEQELSEMAKKNNLSRAELQEALARQGIVFAEYKDFIKNRIERQALVESEITSKIRISEDDILSEYLRNSKNSSSSIFEYTVAHIFFSIKKRSMDAALEKAQAVREQLVSGVDFETLAEQNSEDPNFSTGGLLGSFKAGELSSEFDNALAKLNVNQISEPIKMKSGIHILKLINKKMVSNPKYEKEKPEIRAKLFESAFKKQLVAWVKQKRDESFIRINIK